MRLDSDTELQFLLQLRNAASEADVRDAWSKVITSSLGVSVHLEAGFKDLSFDNVVVEFKDKGLFHGSQESMKYKEATDDRILKYINRWSLKSGLPTSAFIGIATDGVDVALVKVIDGEIHSGNLMKINGESLNYVLEAINQSHRLPLTARNLIENFGVNSQYGGPVLEALYTTLTADLSRESVNKTKLFYSEWKNLYGQVADIADWKRSSIIQSLGFPDDADLSQVLFVENTYNSLLVKFLAAELVSTLPVASFNDFSESFVQLPVDDVLPRVKEQLEMGGFFESANIHNFISEVLFSWYTDSANVATDLALSIKALAERIALYDMYQNQAMHSGDLLKAFYQNLVPDELRRSLGEFYTPDWLVDYMTAKLPGELHDQTILDPSNGSGSFLLRAIELKRNYFEEQHRTVEQQLHDITTEVYGFDLNPLAVQSARVNYLFAISDLLQQAPGYDVTIPVLLSDAIYAPEPDYSTGNYVYTIGSKVADLRVDIPASLVNSQPSLQIAFHYMNHGIDNGDDFESVWLDIQSAGLVQDTTEVKDALARTYCRIVALHERGWDGIWLQIIQNFFWSVELPKFDYVIGNPPWVRWSSLPELYRERVKKTADSYDIFSEHRRYGGNELDISALLTYTVADRWLKDEGTLLFLLPQNHLQNDSSSGFRQLKIGDDYLQPRFVEDLKDLSIFADAVNSPMIFCVRKQRESIEFPVPYEKWNSVSGKKTVSESDDVDSVLAGRDTKSYLAQPLKNTARAPWVYGTERELAIFDSIIGESTYVGRKGITTDLNGIYFPEIIQERDNQVQIRTRPEAGRRDIGPSRKYWIEKDLVFPVAKGAKNIGRGEFYPDENIVCILPNKGILDEDYNVAEKALLKLPKTAKYLSDYRESLETRSTYQKFMKGAPYWAVYNVGEYTLSPYKVAWAEIGNTVKAAVLSGGSNPFSLTNTEVIPDHKLYFSAFSNLDAALFLSGMLNSSIVSEIVERSTVATSRGDVLKHLHLPIYDNNDKEHRELIRLMSPSAAFNQARIDLCVERVLQNS